MFKLYMGMLSLLIVSCAHYSAATPSCAYEGVTYTKTSTVTTTVASNAFINPTVTRGVSQRVTIDACSLTILEIGK